YSYPALPSYVADWNRWQKIVPVHDFMSSQGDGNKRIWLTEYGAPTGGGGVAHTAGPGAYDYAKDYMTEQAQVDILKDAIALYKQFGDWAGPFFWYSLQDHTESQDSPEDFFGLLRRDGSHKPAYDAYKQLIIQ